MSFSVAAKNIALDAVAAVAVFAAVHDDPPGDSGVNEISGGSPAYARKAIAWDAAASGQANKDATDPIFDIPATTDTKFIGLWSLATGGVFYGWMPIAGGNVSGVGCAEASTDVITSVAHGLADADLVILSKVHNEALPSGLAEDTIYHVRDKTTDTFKLAATAGGAAINITVSAELRFQKITAQLFNVQGTLTLDTALLDMIV